MCMRFGKRNLTRKQMKELVYVFTLTDASIQLSDKKHKWSLETNPEFELHKLAFDLINSAYETKLPSFYLINGMKRRTEFSGKKYIPILRDIHNSIFKGNKTIDFLFDEPLWFKNIAFRLAMDLEGSIITKFLVKQKSYKQKKYFQFQFEPEINFSAIDVNLVKEWQKLSSELGIDFTIGKDPRLQNKIACLRSSKKNNILKFHELGGFLLGVKIHKSHEGFISNNELSKQHVLNVVCNILDNDNDLCSKYFQDRKSAENYRKFFINKIYLPAIKSKKMGQAGFEPATARLSVSPVLTTGAPTRLSYWPMLNFLSLSFINPISLLKSSRNSHRNNFKQR